MREASRLSQSYIIAAPSADDCDAQAARLAARAVCSGAEPKPCGKCRDCRNAAAGIHPDIIDVRRMTDDKGRPKREIMVDQVRAMAADASILPNEAERKVYVIHEAELMNESAQNAALKLLEEPPAWVVFILCTVNSERLLPTVRSRCTEISSGGEKQMDAAMKSSRRIISRPSPRGTGCACSAGVPRTREWMCATLRISSPARENFSRKCCVCARRTPA